MAMEAASPDGWDVPPATPEQVAAATAAAHKTFEEQGWAWEALPPWLGISDSDVQAGVVGASIPNPSHRNSQDSADQGSRERSKTVLGLAGKRESSEFISHR
jgi:hypothetical protein